MEQTFSCFQQNIINGMSLDSIFLKEIFWSTLNIACVEFCLNMILTCLLNKKMFNNKSI